MSDPTNQNESNETNSTEATETETSPSDAPVEKKSARDEKGLTLGGRMILRVYAEFARVSLAAMQLGKKPTHEELLTQITLVSEILDLLTLAAGMSEKIGTPDEMRKYLAEHREEDADAISALRDELHEKHSPKISSTLSKILDQALQRGAPCEVCGQPKCISCRECHDCESRKDLPPN